MDWWGQGIWMLVFYNYYDLILEVPWDKQNTGREAIIVTSSISSMQNHIHT